MSGIANTAYDLMIKANHYLMQGGMLNEAQKNNLVRQLLAARSSESEAQRFYRGVRFPNNIDREGRRMYPLFYIPPYNEGKKLQTIYMQRPQTHILSANLYELEILRLLCLFAPAQPDVAEMVGQTLVRLRTTCFGYKGCALGECFDTSLVVLRFLAVAAPLEANWMQHLISVYTRHAGDKKRPRAAEWYFWLCLSELPLAIAAPEISKHTEQMLPWLTTKSAIMNSEKDKMIRSLLIGSLRNCLGRLPAYAHIAHMQPYDGEKV